MPADLFRKWWKKLSKPTIYSFVATILVGVPCHLFAMSNRLLNYNEVSHLFMDQREFTASCIPEGRWTAGFLGQMIGHNYSMSVILGIIGILLIACCAGMITSLLRIKKNLYSALVGASLVVFPALASFFGFTQLGDAWFMAIFFSVLAVWLTEKRKWGVIPAVLLICCSLAVHQAFVSVAVALMYSILYRNLLINNGGVNREWGRIIRYVVVLLLGFVLYYLGVKVTNSIYGSQMTSYYGINEMTNFTPKGIAKGVVYAYLYFARYFFTADYSGSWIMAGVNIFLGCLLLAFSVKKVCTLSVDGKKSNFVWKTILLVLLPLGMNCLPALMADRVGAGVDRYMMYSLVFVWVILMMVADAEDTSAASDNVSVLMTDENGEEIITEQLPVSPKTKAFCLIAVFGMMLNIGKDCVLDNQAYYRAFVGTEQIGNFFNRVAYRMESTEGWNPDVPVYFAVEGELFTNYEVELEAFDAVKEIRATGYEPHFNASGIRRYMNYYLHFPIVVPTEEQQINLKKKVADMPCYPEDGSVCMVDGVLVIKFSNERE